MDIHYISLGYNCWAKMAMKNTSLLIKESLPFDSNITNHIHEVVQTLNELYVTRAYTTQFTKINMIGEGDNGVVLVQEKNGMRLCHFFTKKDIVPVITRNPHRIENIRPEKKLEISTTFDRRFGRLLEYLDDPEKVLCFVRLDKEPNPNWSQDLRALTTCLKQFANPNKYLIYINTAIDSECGDFVSDYDIPVLLWNQEFETDFCKTYDNRFLTLLRDASIKILNSRAQTEPL